MNAWNHSCLLCNNLSYWPYTSAYTDPLPMKLLFTEELVLFKEYQSQVSVLKL